jgi:hypothetical protein
LRENFEEAKFETGKLRNHYPPPLCSTVPTTRATVPRLGVSEQLWIVPAYPRAAQP